MKKRTLIFCFFLVCWAATLVADLKVVIERIDSTDFPKIRVIVQVENEGETFKGLDKSAFRLQIDDLDVPDFTLGTYFSSRQWLAIALAIDTSGSMSGNPLLDAKNAASDFVSRTGVQDRLMMVSFATQAKIQLPFEVNKERVIQSINLLVEKGQTAFHDAVRLSVENLAAIQAPRKAVIILTDGRDNASKISGDQLISLVKEKRIPIFTVGLGKDIHSHLLNELAAISGGLYFQALDSNALMGIYQKIAGNLQNSYFLEFTYPRTDESAKNKVHVIRQYVDLLGKTGFTSQHFFPANGILNSPVQPTGTHSASYPEEQINLSKDSSSPVISYMIYGLLLGMIVAVALLLILKTSLVLKILIFVLIELQVALLVLIWRLIV